jgi:hypothetical protein
MPSVLRFKLPRTLSSLLLTTAVFAGMSGRTRAASVSIGTAHFTNGQTGIGTGTYISAVSGQAAPFNQFIGGDVAGPDFDTSWTFNYAAVSTVFAATLTVGVYDGDFATAGQQLSILDIEGTIITGLASVVFEAGPGASGQYGIYTISLPATVFNSLKDGTASVHLALTGQGSGVLGPTPNNGAGIDFATLTIQEVPEAGTGVLACAGALAVALRRRRTVQS